MTWICVIFWNLSKTKYPCKQIQPTLFKYFAVLFYRNYFAEFANRIWFKKNIFVLWCVWGFWYLLCLPVCVCLPAPHPSLRTAYFWKANSVHSMFTQPAVKILVSLSFCAQKDGVFGSLLKTWRTGCWRCKSSLKINLVLFCMFLYTCVFNEHKLGCIFMIQLIGKCWKAIVGIDQSRSKIEHYVILWFKRGSI